MSSKLFNFIELKPFSTAWAQLELTDDDLHVLQKMIMRNPLHAPVIPATGSLRKLRFAPSGWPKGKRGALRVCFVHFQDYGIVLLVLVYAKTEKDDLSNADKKAIREMIQQQAKVFAERMPEQRS